MIKKILTLLFFLAGCLVLAVDADAQMTDDAVIAFMEEALGAGMSKSDIAKQLAAKGVTADQAERLKSRYERSGMGSSSMSSGTLSDRTRIEIDDILRDDVYDHPVSITEQKYNGRSVFGRNIFISRNLTFAPNTNLPTPADYRLGAGDEVIIDIWGSNEATIRQVISPDGFINIPDVGLVTLNGMTVKEADAYLRKKMGRSYPVDGEGSDSDIKLTLGSIRSIQVNVLGEVVAPGTYQISSLSSIFNALYMAGGVSEVGSLREISLVRNNKVVSVIDMYDFILNGKSSGNTRLQDGDVITVPTYRNLVEVTGKVKRPMCYEMKEGESVATIVEYAGGFAGDAYRSNIRVVRKNGVEYQIFTVDTEDFGSFMLMDGDVLNIVPMIDRYENRVDVQGYVYLPGAYQLGRDVTTVSQLLRKAEGVKEDAFIDRALLYREREDLTKEVIPVDLRGIFNGTAEDVVLQRNDSLHVSGIRDIFDIGTVSIDGEVSAPGTFAFVENMTIEDLIMQAGGLLESASTVKIDVNRRIKNQDSTEQPDSIGQVHTLTLKDGYVVEGGQGFILQPYDHVSVRRSPGYFAQTRVYVSGEVIFPGSYVLTHKTERISDLVRKAGGVNSWAYIKGARLQRKMNDDEKRRVESALGVLDSAKDSIDVDKINATNSYYVGIDLAKALANPGGDADLVLREGDQLIVPEYLNTVKISGNVMYPNTVTYDPGFLVKDYVEMAGGYGYHSKKSKAYIIYMNGTVKRARKLSRGVIEPGCEIVIPQKRKKETELSEILGVATTSSSVATMLATMGNLISSLVK